MASTRSSPPRSLRARVRTCVQIGLSKLRTFADAGALLPLDDLIADSPGLAPDNFADGVAGEATAVAGQIVSVPWISDTRVLFYRKDILEAGRLRQPARDLG